MALVAKDVQAERTRPIFNEANSVARALGIEVPPLPDLAANGSKVSTVVAFLTDDQEAAIASQLERQFDQAHAELFELAVQSHVLLLIYSPRYKSIQVHLDLVEQSAHASGLPESIWGPLVALLRDRAPYQQVKKEIFRLHDRADTYLSSLG